MDSQKCLNFNQIYKYVTQKASANEVVVVEKEISRCKICTEELKFMQSIYFSSQEKTSDDSGKYSAIQPESFFSYEEKFFTDELTKDEQGKFYDILLNSPDYFDGFKNILRSIQEPSEIGKEERKILKQIESANIEDRLTPYEIKCLHRRKKIQDKLKRRFRFPEFNYRRPALLFAGAVFSFITLFLYFSYQKNYLEKTFLLATTDYDDTVQALPFTLEEFRLTGTDVEGFVDFRFTRSEENKSTTHNSDNIEKALKLRPNDPKLNHKMGVMKYLNGHTAEAETFLQKAISLDKSYTPAYNDLSLIKIDQGKSKEALELLQTALKISPNFLEAQFNLAIIYEQLEENQKAVSAWQEYLKKESNKGVIKAVKFRIQELQN